MDEQVAVWNAPSASRIAGAGFVLGITGGCALGTAFGATVLIAAATIDDPDHLGTAVALSLPAGLVGLVVGLVAGVVGSFFVVPVLTIWLRGDGVQGRSVEWVRRKAQLLAMVVTALAAYIVTLAFADWSQPNETVVVYVLPSLIAIGYAACVARHLVLGLRPLSPKRAMASRTSNCVQRWLT